MSVSNVLAGVAVKSREDAQAWYERLLGQPATVPMSEVAEWQFPGGGSLQVFTDPERAGHSSVTFSVTSLDDQVAHLASLGIPVGDRTDADTVRTAMLEDPDGNRIVFAQPLSGTLTR